MSISTARKEHHQSHHVTNLTLGLFGADGALTAPPLRFDALREPRYGHIGSVTPSSGPERGGTLVTVRGDGFAALLWRAAGDDAAAAPRCRFGASALPSRALRLEHASAEAADDEPALLCVAPSTSNGPGVVALQVALNGAQFVGGAEFTYTAACSGGPTCA